MFFDAQKIRKKVEKIIIEKGISKTKLGGVLGGQKKGEDPRVSINRANRFFSGEQKKISVDQLGALAEFFEKPMEWFSQDEEKFENTLSSPERYTPQKQKSLASIRKSLKEMNFDEAYIENLITQLKAMEAYNSQGKGE